MNKIKLYYNCAVLNGWYIKSFHIAKHHPRECTEMYTTEYTNPYYTSCICSVSSRIL